MNRKMPLAMLLCLVVGALCACGKAADQTEDSPPLSEAEAIFKQNCVVCHGNNLEGKLGPETNLQTIGGKWTREQIVNQITNGGKTMPSFGRRLNDDDINKLADWLSAKK